MKKCVWKVPRRSIYCDTFSSWVHETLYCFFVLKFFKRELNDMLVAGHQHQFRGDLYDNPLPPCSAEARRIWQTLSYPEPSL